jgi:hypothetical protein
MLLKKKKRPPEEETRAQKKPLSYKSRCRRKSAIREEIYSLAECHIAYRQNAHAHAHEGT